MFIELILDLIKCVFHLNSGFHSLLGNFDLFVYSESSAINLLDAGPNQANLGDTLDNINSVIGIICGVGAILGFLLGVHYLETLREKQTASLFSFWTHIRVRMLPVFRALESDNSLLNNMYDSDIRRSFESQNPPIEKITKFKDYVVSLYTFLEEAENQMPAYLGWSNDYSTLVSFLSNVVQYDICNPDSKFINNDYVSTYPQRDEYCRTVCLAMKRMITKIQERQKTIECSLYRYSQFVNFIRRKKPNAVMCEAGDLLLICEKLNKDQVKLLIAYAKKMDQDNKKIVL